MHSRHLHAPLCGIFAPNSGFCNKCVSFGQYSGLQ
ncbi:DUF6783 domain-containing protein [Robinsoniella peoriensis]